MATVRPVDQPFANPSSSGSSDAFDNSTQSPSVTPPSFRRVFSHDRKRSHSLPFLPSLPESSTEETASSGKCRVRTYSLTRTPPTISIQVPMDNFVEHCITIPVVTCESWEKKVITALLQGAVKTDFSPGAIQGVVNDTFHHCLDHSSILERIKVASKLLDSSKYPFLNDFSKDMRPLIFWNKYASLRTKSPDDYKFLCALMGGSEAYRILRKTTASKGGDFKSFLRLQVDAVAPLEKKKQALFNCSISFPNASDPLLLRFASVPPFAQNYKEFEESFRSFFSDGPFPKECIRFNKECLKIPDYKDLGIEESDREEHFVKWLISEFQRKMNLPFAPEPQAQIQSFVMAPKLDPKFVKNTLRPLIVKNLKREFKKDVSLPNFSEKMESFFGNFKKETADFSAQLRPFSGFLSTYLMNCSKFNKKEWEEVSDILISWYGRLYQLKEKHSFIPSLALMQAVGYPSYAICGQFMHSIRLPNPLDESAPYRLVLNRDEIGSFDIHFKKNCFDAIHIKWFNVVCNNNIKAKVLIHWKVSGMLHSFDHSFDLSSHDAYFPPDCNEAERLMILDQLLFAIQNVKEAGFNGIVTYGLKALITDSPLAKLFDSNAL